MSGHDGDLPAATPHARSNEDAPGLPRIPLAIWGRVEDASYQEVEMPHTVGNPYLEALPRILSTPAAATRLQYAPEWTPDLRDQPDHIRLHLIRDIPRFYIPLAQTLELQSAVSSMIRAGYQDRNPVEIGYWRHLDRRITALAQAVAPDVLPGPIGMSSGRDCMPPLAWHARRGVVRGFSMIGITGAGKSSAMESVLGLYPQIIRHTSYGGQPFPTRQVVWLKLQCPYNGAISSLCLNFFEAIDNLLEDTSYKRAYTRNYRARAAEMLLSVARVAANHGLGLLVIDEIQRLSRAKSGGAGAMLDFFGELVDTIGVPVVLIGTYKAQSMLRGDFLEARRGTGSGPGHWGPLEPDASWDILMRALFRYQYLRMPIPDPVASGLGAALHEVSQGIPDFAVKAYMLAQVRAVTTRREALSVELIHSVARDYFLLAKPWLDRVKMMREAFALGHIDRKQLTERLAKLPEVNLIDLSGLIQSLYATLAARVQSTTSAASLPSDDAADSTVPADHLAVDANLLVQAAPQHEVREQRVSTARTNARAAIAGKVTAESTDADTGAPGGETAGRALAPAATTAPGRSPHRAGAGHARSGAPKVKIPSSTALDPGPDPDAGSGPGAATRRRAPTRRTRGSFPVETYSNHEGLVGIVARGIARTVAPHQALRDAGMLFNPQTDALPAPLLPQRARE